MTPRSTLMTRHHPCPKVRGRRFGQSCGRYLRPQEPEVTLQPVDGDLLMPMKSVYEGFYSRCWNTSTGIGARDTPTNPSRASSIFLAL